MGSIKENFAINLRRLRESRGFTLIDLAKLTGLDKGTINKWENQKQGFRYSNLEIIANALNCPIDELTASPPENKADFISSIVQDLGALNEPELRAVRALMDSALATRATRVPKLS